MRTLEEAKQAPERPFRPAAAKRTYGPDNDAPLAPSHSRQVPGSGHSEGRRNPIPDPVRRSRTGPKRARDTARHRKLRGRNRAGGALNPSATLPSSITVATDPSPS